MYLWILLLVALFHLTLYYWNLDFPKRHPPTDWTDTKEILENHLKELKQYPHG